MISYPNPVVEPKDACTGAVYMSLIKDNNTEL